MGHTARSPSCLVEYNDQFEVVQMAGPSAVPRRLGAITLSRAEGGGVGSLMAAGRYVYWAASEADPFSGGLRIFDVADGSRPELVGRLDIPRAGSMVWKGSSLAVSGTTVSFAAADGLHMIDISDPREPLSSDTAIYSWPTAFGTCRGGYPILVGDYAYVGVNCYSTLGNVEGLGTGGLAIYRVHSPRPMTCDGQCVDVEAEHRHCGGCQKDCGPYQKCVWGACVPH